MPYRYATEPVNYADYASGRVLYNAPGQPVLPVRLVSELFSRCQAVRQKMGFNSRAVVYDPCCGSAYHLTALAYFHWGAIDTIIGSDIDAEVLTTAERNLSLLTPSGLQTRAQALAQLHEQYGKQSHAAALESAERLRQQQADNLRQHAIETKLFSADSTSTPALTQALNGRHIDILLADVPYGRLSAWQTPAVSNGSFLWHLLDGVRAVLTPSAVVGICADKAQKCAHDQYQQVGRFQIGKRRVTLLQLSQ